MEVRRTPPELRLLWPEFESEPDGQPVDNETAVLAERRAKVFRLYTRGFSLRDIAEHETIRCSKATAGRDVQHVLDSYRLITVQDAGAHVAQQLSRLAHMESEALEAWERSKRVSEETEISESDGFQKSTHLREKRKQRDGNPAFLQVARDCWNDRCKLLKLIGQDADPRKGADRGGNSIIVEIGPRHVEPPVEGAS